jgi:large subunit ribosomal protein L5e
LTAGLTNYSASYATGLLLARRVLATLKLDKTFAGNKKIDGNDYDVSAAQAGERRPFTCILDMGLIRPTIGNRVFGVLKGATDGGLHVPHSVKKFPGFSKDKDSKKETYEAEVHRDRIFGSHIDEYMEKLKSESADCYKRQFSQWDKCLKDNKVKTVEELMTKVFESIKKDFTFVKKGKKIYKPKFLDEKKTQVQSGKNVYKRFVKISLEERKRKVQDKIKIAKDQIKMLSGN